MVKKYIKGGQKILIDELVAYYKENENEFKYFLEILKAGIDNSKELKNIIHSIKWRLKDPEHLRDKLIRKSEEARTKGKKFSINKKNIFKKINDLAGFRILHLYTQQMAEIDPLLRKLFEEKQFEKIEGPIAKTWDDETRRYFNEIGIETKSSDTLYTSVHYVILLNTKTGITCEIQVRTLMEEVWGEVDHTINYPYPSESECCREQIKVLARLTSSSSRLVDSIFKSLDIHKNGD